MARADRHPLFRARLFPAPEPWTAGPGLVVHTVRFVLPASIHLPQLGAYQLCAALLSPELPYSVVPFALRNAVSEARQPGESERPRPAPSWRGVPCRFGTIRLRAVNDLAPDDTWEFEVLVMTPEQNPPGPREQDVRLGAEFFRHYACRILISYAAIRYRDEEGSDRRGIDPSLPCGYLEKP